MGTGPICRIVTAGGLHPASSRHQRLRLCELHFEDRRRARSRWSSAKNWYDADRENRTNPGSWADYERRIEWTPIDALYTHLNPEARYILRNTADALHAQIAALIAFHDEERYTTTPLPEFQRLTSAMIRAMSDAELALRRVATEPDP